MDHPRKTLPLIAFSTVYSIQHYALTYFTNAKTGLVLYTPMLFLPDNVVEPLNAHSTNSEHQLPQNHGENIFIKFGHFFDTSYGTRGAVAHFNSNSNQNLNCVFVQFFHILPI